eukprot:TRINITY_DN6493_c0_g1_i6.p1 TRINITY_DN6493_c0_g1~~TRINITY_DN6493_c0_g1_i6.p1  ORF type:complete len:118 (-),score=33.88 TRINITY_DN6493_c0_g1_i6:70-423(-)
MSVSLSTQNLSLTQAARFWSDYISALKGNQDLNAPLDEHVRSYYPSIMETIPPSHPDLRREFGKLEDEMMRQQRGRTQLTPVLGGANDRIHTVGYSYCPVHTETYGTYRNRAARGYQ